MKQDAATSPTAGSGTSGDNSLARSALRRRLGDLLSVGIFSSVVNVLTLTGSIYMLQVYDRVLLSRSVETLVVLSLLALVAYGLQGALDVLRMRILSRIGARIDACVDGELTIDDDFVVDTAECDAEQEAVKDC